MSSAPRQICLRLELLVVNRRVRQLAVKRLAVAHTAAQEARPWRNGHLGLDRLGQQTP